eukprot:SAG22_NODE_240_length_14178_cov_18.579160_1_plen_2540_part_00
MNSSIDGMDFVRRSLVEESFDTGVGATVTTAEDFHEHLSANWLWYLNWAPLVGASVSLACSLYVVGSNFIKKDADTSLLEEVFSFASICTACVAALMLFSIRGGESNTAQTDPDGFICQATGAAVAYFQLATMFWLAAGSHSVYTFVCKKKTSGTITLPTFAATPKKLGLNDGAGMVTGFQARMEAAKAKQAADEAAAAAAFATASEEAEPDSEAEGADGGAGVVAAVQVRAPVPVKASEETGEDDAAARLALIQKAEVRMVQFYSMPCWGIPAGLVAVMLTFQKPSAFGYQQLHDNGWCTITTNLPMVSFFLYNLPILVCMYIVAACYYFCFAKVKAKRLVLEQIENEVMYDRSAHMIRKKTFLSYQRNHMASQAVRLALIVMTACWMPICLYGLMLIASNASETFGEKGAKAVAKFHAISSMLSPLFGVLLFIVFEIRFKFRTLYEESVFRQWRKIKFQVRKCLKLGPPKHKKKRIRDEEDEDDEDDGGFCSKIGNVIGIVRNTIQQTVELGLLVIWGLVMWVPLDVFRRDIKSTPKLLTISATYMFCLFLPALALYKVVPFVFDTLEDWDILEHDQRARSVVFNTFTFVYLGFMFVVVGMTLYMNRKTPDLLLNADPRSHVRWSPQNLQKVIMLVVEAQQLSALLLTHPYLAGIDYAGDLKTGLATARVATGLSNGMGSGSFDGDGLDAPSISDADQFQDAEDGVVLRFEVLKLWILDVSSFSFLDEYKNEIFAFKLWMSVLATLAWVLLVAIPTVVDNIRLQRSAAFDKIFSKVTVVQELLAGPAFFVIFSSFIATVDCAQSQTVPGVWVLEERDDIVCWTGDHFFYATCGLTGLMAYVPLAALTMVEDYDDKIDVRFIPLYHRIEVLTKGIMAFTVSFTNTLSPSYSFPFVGIFALWMVIATRMIKPGCILWTNHLKEMGYAIMLWTAFAGHIIYAGWEDRIKSALGIPLVPSMIMFSGWAVIIITTITKTRRDILMLKKVKKKKRNQVEAWAESLTEYQAGVEHIQLSKLDSLHLGTSEAFRFSTHHEILALIFLLRSNASAGVKQRALQILAHATSSSSNAQLSEEAKEKAVLRLTTGEADGEDEDDTDSSSDDEPSISVQSRRRLLGYEGTEQDMDESDFHYPELVLVSPLALIDLLANEFQLTKKRDQASKEKESKNWITEVAKTAEEQEHDLAKKKKKRFGRKKKGGDEPVMEATEAFKREGEVLFMLHRVKHMLTVDMIEGIGSEAPQQFLVKTLLSQLRKDPPDVLRLMIEGAGGKGHMIGEGSGLHDDHLLEHVLDLTPDLLVRGADDSENEAMEKIKKIRRMYAESEVHNIMKTVMHLPNECLELREDVFTADRDEYERNHFLVKKIARLEEEKFLIDSEITHLKDQAISIVAKVFLMRVFAVYAEHPEFARKLHAQIGADQIVEFLMHGDENLQTASTVCLYQLARQDAQCLDALEETEGALVYIATRMTDPLQCSIITHRIAVDLLVEVAKRFELRKPMVEAGLIGPLLTLAKAYSYILHPDSGSFSGKEAEVGTILRERMEADHESFATGAEEGFDKENKPGSQVLTDTKQIHRWCPFKLKGVGLFSEHILLSAMRIFQQLTDEDVFRAEFIGRHHGLRWIRDFVYPIPMPNVKLMAMRVLYGMGSEPFGIDDIIADKKMLAVYDELADFKAANDATITPGVFDDGSALVMHSRHNTVRLKIHRVAEFLKLDHANGLRKSSDGKHTVRLIMIRNLKQHESSRKFSHNELDILEVARERTLDECFGICMDASASPDDALRTAATSVLVILAKKVEFLELETFEKLNSRLLECRLNAIEMEDDIMYEEICAALVHLRRTKRHILADFSFGFSNEADLFDTLWMYFHDNIERFLGCESLEEVIARPYWAKAHNALTPTVIGYITNSKNTEGHKVSARIKFMRDVLLDEQTEVHHLDRMEDGGVAAHQFSEEASRASEKAKEKFVDAVRRCIRYVRARGPQDEHNKNKHHANQKALGKVMSAEEVEKMRSKKESERTIEERKMEAKFKAARLVKPTVGGGEGKPEGSGVKVLNPLMMAEMALAADEDVPAPTTIGAPAPPGFPFAFKPGADVAPKLAGAAESSDSDASDAEDSQQTMSDQKAQTAEIRKELDAYASGTGTEPMEFEITHKLRKTVHIIAQELGLVHYSTYNEQKGRRVLTVKKPEASAEEKEKLKQQLLIFYDGPDDADALEFETNTELRKFLHMEAEALHLVHYSQWRDELGQKVLIVEKMAETRVQKSSMARSLVEYAAGQSNEPLVFEVSNEMRKFLHGVADGIGLNHVSSPGKDGKRVLTVEKRPEQEEQQQEELVEAAIKAAPEPEAAPVDQEVPADMEAYEKARMDWLLGISDTAPPPPLQVGAGTYYVDFRTKMDQKKDELKEAMTGNSAEDWKAAAQAKQQIVAALVDEALGKVDSSIEKDCKVLLAGKSLEGVPIEEHGAWFTVLRVDNSFGGRAMIEPTDPDAGFYKGGVKMGHDTSWFPTADLTVVEAAPGRQSQFVAVKDMGFIAPKKTTIIPEPADADDDVNT